MQYMFVIIFGQFSNIQINTLGFGKTWKQKAQQPSEHRGNWKSYMSLHDRLEKKFCARAWKVLHNIHY